MRGCQDVAGADQGSRPWPFWNSANAAPGFLVLEFRRFKEPSNGCVFAGDRRHGSEREDRSQKSRRRQGQRKPLHRGRSANGSSRLNRSHILPLGDGPTLVRTANRAAISSEMAARPKPSAVVPASEKGGRR